MLKTCGLLYSDKHNELCPALQWQNRIQIWRAQIFEFKLFESKSCNRIFFFCRNARVMRFGASCKAKWALPCVAVSWPNCNYVVTCDASCLNRQAITIEIWPSDGQDRVWDGQWLAGGDLALSLLLASTPPFLVRHQVVTSAFHSLQRCAVAHTHQVWPALIVRKRALRHSSSTFGWTVLPALPQVPNRCPTDLI